MAKNPPPQACIVIDKDLLAQAHTQAKHEDVSLSQLVRRLLREHIAAHADATPPGKGRKAHTAIPKADERLVASPSGDGNGVSRSETTKTGWRSEGPPKSPVPQNPKWPFARE